VGFGRMAFHGYTMDHLSASRTGSELVTRVQKSLGRPLRQGHEKNEKRVGGGGGERRQNTCAPQGCVGHLFSNIGAEVAQAERSRGGAGHGGPAQLRLVGWAVEPEQSSLHGAIG